MTFRDLVEGRSARDLAGATGRSRQVAHSWLTGQMLPDVATLPSLAKALEIDLGDLTRIVAADIEQRNAAKEAARAS